MIKNIILIGLISFVFLMATTTSVYAADDEETIADPEDDVLDYLDIDGGEYTDQKPNIDIISLTYSKTGRSVSLDLEVKGVIEDKGDIEDEESFDAVLYSILFTTSTDMDEKEYEVVYMNKECTLNGEERSITYDVDGSVLSVSFTLEDADETIFNVLAITSDFNSLTYKYYFDELTSMNIIAFAGEEYTGKVGEKVNFSGAAIGGTEIYTYSWDFGDGTTSDELEGSSYDELLEDHIYEKAGTYKAILTVIDSEGNVTSSTATVIISSGDKTDDNSNSGLIIFISLIAIVVVIVVIVAVYVIKR